VEKLRALLITASKQNSYTKGTTLQSNKEYANKTQNTKQNDGELNENL